MAKKKLIISVNGQAAQEVALYGSVSIGRAPDNAVTIADNSVARYHAIIEQRGDSFWVNDLGSVNGTLVNGQPVAGERRLETGDTIALGSATLIKVAGVQAEPPRETQPANTSNQPPVTSEPAKEAPPLATPPETSSVSQGLSAGMIGAAVTIGLIVTVFVGLAGYVIYQKSRKPEVANNNNGGGRRVVLETPTPSRTSDATPAATTSVNAGALDVRLAAQSLATQLTGNPLDYYYFEPEFLNEIATNINNYRGFSLAEARKYQRDINLAFQNAGVNKKYGFILALSESRFGADSSNANGVGMWQLPQAQVKDFLRQNEDASALNDSKRSAEIAADFLKERIVKFEDADFMYALASCRMNTQQIQTLLRNLQNISSTDRRNFWKMVNSGLVSREGAAQVIRFFAAGIVGENPQALGLPPGRLSDL